MSRESIAKIELDKAYDRWLKNTDYTKELLELLTKEAFKTDEIYREVCNNITINGQKLDSRIMAKLGLGANGISDLLSGQDLKRVAVGGITDTGLLALSKFIPAVGQVSLVLDVFNLIDKMTYNTGAFDLRAKVQSLYDKITNTTADLPDLEALKRGILKITMPNGEVYARPLIDTAGKYLLTGGNKHGEGDILFGSSGNDILNGHNGSDILIGGDGRDDYFVDNGDIIKDSDGKGRVFLSESFTQLRGGIQIERGSKIYEDKDGIRYELKDNGDLVINNTITIENFSNNNLGIHLSEFDEINIIISDNQAVEKDEGMRFKISLSKGLKDREFVIDNVNKKIYKFSNLNLLVA